MQLCTTPSHLRSRETSSKPPQFLAMTSDPNNFYERMRSRVSTRYGIADEDITVLARGRVGYLWDVLVAATTALEQHGPRAVFLIRSAIEELETCHGVDPRVDVINRVLTQYQLPMLPGLLRSRNANDAVRALEPAIDLVGPQLLKYIQLKDQMEMPWGNVGTYLYANPEDYAHAYAINAWLKRIDLTRSVDRVHEYLESVGPLAGLAVGAAVADNSWGDKTRHAPLNSALNAGENVDQLLKALGRYLAHKNKVAHV